MNFVHICFHIFILQFLADVAKDKNLLIYIGFVFYTHTHTHTHAQTLADTSDMDYVVTNTVVKAHLVSRQGLKLGQLTKRLTNAIYNPKTFAGIIWKQRAIGGCCLLFSNGKMIVNGFKSVALCKKGARRYARSIQVKIGEGVLKSVAVVTMTLLADLKQTLCLESLAVSLGGQYEPELFNALILKKGKIHFSIFRSGKIVIVGVKSVKVVEAIIYPALLDILMS